MTILQSLVAGLVLASLGSVVFLAVSRELRRHRAAIRSMMEERSEGLALEAELATRRRERARKRGLYVS